MNLETRKKLMSVSVATLAPRSTSAACGRR